MPARSPPGARCSVPARQQAPSSRWSKQSALACCESQKVLPKFFVFACKKSRPAAGCSRARLEVRELEELVSEVERLMEANPPPSCQPWTGLILVIPLETVGLPARTPIHYLQNVNFPTAHPRRTPGAPLDHQPLAPWPLD